MVRKRDEESNVFYLPARCLYCHGDPFMRTIHLLKIKAEDVVAAHLKQEFPREGEKDDGFIKSELVHWGSIRRMFDNPVDDDGSRIPVWLAWAKAHAVVTRTSTGWHFAPKYRPNPSAAVVKRNREHYVATGEINPQYLGGMYAHMKPYKALGDKR